MIHVVQAWYQDSLAPNYSGTTLELPWLNYLLNYNVAFGEQFQFLGIGLNVWIHEFEMVFWRL